MSDWSLVDQPWSLASEQVARFLGVDPSCGLDEQEAQRRAAQAGKNLLRETKPISAWRILLDQFKSFVIGLLLVAATLSLALQQRMEGLAILVVVIINAAIGFLTELRAVRSMESLRRLGQTTVKVLREGKAQEMAAVDLVPGDVVLIEGGDIVTADIRLFEASKLQANESTLTGESAPVSKQTDPVSPGAVLAERHSMLFKGTSVTRGAGAGIVAATGIDTALGRIASLSQEAEKAATPLEIRLEQLGRRLIWITLGIAAATITAGILRGKDVLLMVETGIALAVAAIPEGLPIVATLALARGMWRMARRNALINRLSAVETLGATSVILTDKTGTLTENQMTVTRYVLSAQEVEVEGSGLETQGGFTCRGQRLDCLPPVLLRAIEAGVLCNNASLQGSGRERRSVGDPMEVALLIAGAKAGVSRSELLKKLPEVREEAFDPQARTMATFHRWDGRFRVTVKGAAEAVVAACNSCLQDGEAVPLQDSGRQRWLKRGQELASQGLRVLALAEKEADSSDQAPYENLTLIGLAGMLDPPRRGVEESLRQCRQAGIRVVMVTGDQSETAESIAGAIGLTEQPSSVIEGRDLSFDGQLSPQQRNRLLGTSLFARVEPEQKLRLIELHQKAGAVVAMTGDGVNDAPALRKADIGVAMGKRGTQVAREASDMVLQDDSFESIVLAVRQGRIIFTNIRRFVLYLLSCNISEIMIVFGASAWGAPLPVLPLQILFLNLVTDVFPALALGFGEGDEDVMDRPPRNSQEPIMGRRHWIAMGVWGILISFCVLAALATALLWLGFEEERAVTVSFLTLAFAQVFHVFNMRGRGSSAARNDVTRNPWVWGAVALCSALLLASVHLPGLSTVLGTADPGRVGWLVVLGGSLLPLLIGQSWLIGCRLASYRK